MLAAALVLLLVLDRVGAAVAEAALARQLQRTQHLAEQPSVTIRGFPFLTQALRGRYTQIDLTAQNLQRQGVHVSTATVHLFGVLVNTGDVLGGRAGTIRVTRETGTAELSYADLNTLLRHAGGPLGALATISAAGPGRIRITGPAGLTLRAAVTVSSRGILITPNPGDLSALPPFLATPVTAALAAPLPLPSLPLGVRLVSGTVDSRGVHLRGTANSVTLSNL